MTHATDDQITEIERAINDGDYDRAKAMLRACKGGAVKPLEWHNGHAHGIGHHYFTRNGCLYRSETSGETGLHCGPSWEIEQVAQADYERRILSALEPAPDARQEVWRAGVDAAIDAIRAKAKANAHRGEYLNAIHVLCALAEKGPTDE